MQLKISEFIKKFGDQLHKANPNLDIEYVQFSINVDKVGGPHTWNAIAAANRKYAMSTKTAFFFCTAGKHPCFASHNIALVPQLPSLNALREVFKLQGLFINEWVGLGPEDFNEEHINKLVKTLVDSCE